MSLLLLGATLSSVLDLAKPRVFRFPYWTALVRRLWLLLGQMRLLAPHNWRHTVGGMVVVVVVVVVVLVVPIFLLFSVWMISTDKALFDPVIVRLL
jgi:hypothetical protein